MKLFYVDPQSYNNLADYDRYLLSSIPCQRYFFCSQKFCDTLDGVQVIRCFSYNDLTGMEKIGSYVKSIILILRKIKEYRPDVIHFQWFKIPIFDYLVLKQMKGMDKNIRVIFTAHNALPHNTGKRYLRIYKKIYGFVDAIVVHGNNTKRELVEIFGVDAGKISVIPHGFLPRKSDVPKGGRNFQGITFSLVGSLSTYKGVDLLVDAWLSSDILMSNDLCRLIVAGCGKMDCFSKIHKGMNIQLINRFLSDTELDEIVNQTDVAVLPYRKISQSGVLLTMLAEHKPVIVSNVGDLTQPFEIARCGWILQDIQIPTIRKKLEQIVADRSVLDAIKNDAYAWSKLDNYYSWKDIGGGHMKVYQAESGYPS